MQLGQVIRGWRDNQRMGVREAANILGVSPATLSRIENGKPCSQEVLITILDWLLH